MADMRIKDEPCKANRTCQICFNEIAKNHIIVPEDFNSPYRYLDYCSEECKTIILFQLVK